MPNGIPVHVESAAPGHELVARYDNQTKYIYWESAQLREWPRGFTVGSHVVFDCAEDGVLANLDLMQSWRRRDRRTR